VASHSLQIPLSQARKQNRGRTAVRTPSVRVIITAFIALLILFSWLRFILALEIALTGRQIQIKTEELERIERINNDLRRKIAEAMSPERLATMAEEQGFMPHEPIYVPLPRLLVEPTSHGPAVGTSQLVTTDEIVSPAEGDSLWGIASEEFDTLFEEEVIP
jgi:cell division protein FtsL